MSKTILIAGGSGLIGTFLRKRFSMEGHEVRFLTRSQRSLKEEGAYFWDPTVEKLDSKALAGVDVVINLAGDSIAGNRWSDKRKQQLWDSRIKSSGFLLSRLKENNSKLKCYIGSSAIGIYGDRGEEVLLENSKPGAKSFLVELSEAWEDAHHSFEMVAERVVILRIGIVLANEGGALPELRRSVAWGAGAYLGNGRQYMSWIHMDDLVSVFSYIINHPQILGVVNGVTPNPVSNYEFTKALISGAAPGWLAPVPAILLRLALGQMADVLLNSQRVLPRELERAGFEFAFPTLKRALGNLQMDKD